MKRLFCYLVTALVVLSCGKENRGFKIRAIDIGLSVKWANANLGALAPEESGDIFAWGETETKEIFQWETYKWTEPFEDDHFPFSIKKYNNSIYYPGVLDNKIVLDAADDAATVKLGGKWRMPTKTEMDELISTQINSNYRWELKILNGKGVLMVTYLRNKNSIVFPLGYRQYCWSSSLDEEGPRLAWCMAVSSDNAFVIIDSRCAGYSIRPVSD